MVYYGNLMMHRATVESLKEMGFTVTTVVTEGLSNTLSQCISTLSGEPLVSKVFEHIDLECLYNEATQWLSSMRSELSKWN